MGTNSRRRLGERPLPLVRRLEEAEEVGAVADAVAADRERGVLELKAAFDLVIVI